MPHYREHVSFPRPRPPGWWFGFVLACCGVLILLYGIADMWDVQSDARLSSSGAEWAALRERAKAEAVEELQPTILAAYRAGLAAGGRSCQRGGL